jgi:sorbitol-specific phosphotransferase system component IIA
MEEINKQTASRLRRISANLFLDSFEREKLLIIYNNSNKNLRDYCVSVIEKESESRNFSERRRTRMKIRNS